MVEVLVVVLLSVIIAVAVYELLNSTYQEMSYQQEINRIQTDAFVALYVMSKDIKMAGYLIREESGILSGNDSTTAPDSLTFKRAAFEPFGVVSAVTSTGTTYEVEVYCTKGVSGLDFVAFEGDGTRSYAAGGASCSAGGSVTISISSSELAVDPEDLEDLGAYKVETISYEVVNGVLRRNDQPFLEDVDDLQFAYLVGTTWYLDEEGKVSLPSWDQVSAVKICLVMKTSKKLKGRSFSRPACLNRPASSVSDSYLRRKYEVTVHLVNLKL